MTTIEKKGINRLIFKNRYLVYLVFSAFILSGCSEPAPPEDDEAIEIIEHELDEMDSKRALLVESIIRSSPTLAQTSEIFGSIGTEFNREYLNDLENVSKYSTLRAQGINLGAYLADLGYITSYEQSQEVIFYMNCAQKMAEGIGVMDVFDEKTVERMEMNIDNKDSLLTMISDLYWKTDAFLKELGRQNISALIICGAWIEAMHIGAMILKESGDDEVIYTEIKAQKSNLKKILNLLETFENDENITFFQERLTLIYEDYQTIPVSGNDQVTEAQLTPIKNLTQKIETLRNEITMP